MLKINSEVINSAKGKPVTYYSTTSRGTLYTFNREHNDDGWVIHSRRLALGSFNAGGYKWFDTLQELEDNYKAFKGLTQLLCDEL